MRVYTIGNDGITLCRSAPAKVNNGEIAVASNEELHAAPLSAKRLLALWNALRLGEFLPAKYRVTSGRRLHGSADIALPLAEDVDKCLTV